MGKTFFVIATLLGALVIIVSLPVALFSRTEDTEKQGPVLLREGEYAIVHKASNNEEDPNITVPLYDNR